jgi:hypothetical protein
MNLAYIDIPLVLVDECTVKQERSFAQSDCCRYQKPHTNPTRPIKLRQVVENIHNLPQ